MLYMGQMSQKKREGKKESRTLSPLAKGETSPMASSQVIFLKDPFSPEN